MRGGLGCEAAIEFHTIHEPRCENLKLVMFPFGLSGEASYAAVPHLLRIGKQVCPDDWNLYAFVSTIDECRHEPDNPPVPEWLKRDYAAAWNEIGHMSIEAIGEAEDTTLIDALFQTIALYKKQYALARFAALSEPERKAALDELGWA